MAKTKKSSPAPKSANASRSITTSNGVTITHGAVTLTIPQNLSLPAQAGRLSQKEMARIPRPPHGIGLIADQVAGIVEKSGDSFDVPRGVTPASLREKGRRAEDIDDVILDVEVILAQLKQANLILDSEAWAELRKVNDQVKAQGRQDKQLLTKFAPLREYLANAPRAPKEPKDEGK